MKTKFVSLAMCALVVTLASSVYAGGNGTNGSGRGFRPIQRAGAREAAKARVDDGSNSGSVMNGSLMHPSQAGGNSDQFKGLFDKTPTQR